MAPTSPALPESPAPAPLPRVRLELRQGSGRPTVHEVADATFLIGGVPGCDLRLPGTNTPPVLCLIACQPDGVLLRKLAPVHPVLVNGKAVTTAGLSNGDRITLGITDLTVTIEEAPPAAPFEPDARLQELRDQVRSLEAERTAWLQRREEIERECRQRIETATTASLQFQQQREQTAREVSDLEARAEAVAVRERELDGLRQELASLRQQLYDRYRKRRDRLAGLQEAIRRAARKLQERKRSLDEQTQQIEQRDADDRARHAELTACAEELTAERHQFEQQRRQLEARQQEADRKMAAREVECDAREHKLLRDRQALEQGKDEHQADLARLDRLEALLEQRQQQLQTRAIEVDRRWEQMQRESRDLEDQASQLEEWRQQLTELAERLEKQKTEQDAVGSQVGQRTAALESQQAMLASLRTRLERMREEVQRNEQALAAQRTAQETAAAELQQKQAEVQRLRTELEEDRLLFGEQRQQLEQREARLEAAVAQLRQREDELAVEQQRVQQREDELASTTASHVEQADLVRGRSEQLAEVQKRLEAQRLALNERDTALTQAEKTLAGLQEQLRRRSEELAARQRAQQEQEKQQAAALAELERQQAVSDEARGEAEDRLKILHAALDERSGELEARTAGLAQREEALRREQERLQNEARLLHEAGEALAEERFRWEAQRGEATGALQRERGEVETARAGAAELQKRLPELEERAKATLDRLLRTREQVREHLAEVSSYALQGRQDLETLQAGLQAEAERVRRQELELHKARDEHRLAVAAFRQQLIEWQGQVTELKRSLQQGETRLEQRQAELAEQARQADAANRALAEQAEQLQQARHEVDVRRGEVHRHLDDMREWYRTKLRELAAGEADKETRRQGDKETVGEDSTSGSLSPCLLVSLSEFDEGDRQLGELLRSLELVDTDTLARLLGEARRRRRSLRQLLLSGGYLTLYQVALIEAGNLDALVLGPVRVIDRLRATPCETVYRVFDPRRSQELVLRHLAEAEMQDAVHPDEFRQRFAAAAQLAHPHLEATYEVLEIGGRPAVLQEWVRGLPSSEWSALAAVPGVWFRLMCQSALAVHTVQQAGLTHGRLHAGSFMLTADGVVKLCGLGEPNWLAEPEAPDDDESESAREPLDDLAALGHIAAAWAAIAPLRKGSKSKPLPESLQTVLRKLTAEQAEERYASAAALLEELDTVGADVTPNAAAWDRLLKEVREFAEDPVSSAA